jgi:hypothetical protein
MGLIEPDHDLRCPVHELPSAAASFTRFDFLKSHPDKQPFKVAIAKGASAFPE